MYFIKKSFSEHFYYLEFAIPNYQRFATHFTLNNLHDIF